MHLQYGKNSGKVFPEAHEEVMAIDRSDLIDNNENDIIEDV